MASPPRGALLAVLALAAAAAGCLGDAPAEAGPRTYPWGLEECRYAIAVVPLPASTLQPLLPPGFTPRRTLPPEAAALPGAPDAELHADAYQCAGATGLDGGRVQGASYGSFYVPVEAPAGVADPAYPAAFVKLDFLAWDPARAQVLQDGGLPAHRGVAAVVHEGARLTALLAFHEDAQGAGDLGGFSLTGAFGPAEPQEGDLPFLEATPLDGDGGGLAVWHARLHDATFATGTGILRVEGPLRDVVGGEAVPVRFATGTWNLDQADVTFPIPWP